MQLTFNESVSVLMELIDLQLLEKEEEELVTEMLSDINNLSPVDIELIFLLPSIATEVKVKPDLQIVRS